jgi:hypothetical protein
MISQAYAEKYSCYGTVEYENGKSIDHNLAIEVSDFNASINGVGFRSDKAYIDKDSNMRIDRRFSSSEYWAEGWTSIITEENLGSYDFKFDWIDKTLIFESTETGKVDFTYRANCR